MKLESLHSALKVFAARGVMQPASASRAAVASSLIVLLSRRAVPLEALLEAMRDETQ